MGDMDSESGPETEFEGSVMRLYKPFVLVCAALLAASVSLGVSVPRLACVYYGQVRNEFGRPCLPEDGVRFVLSAPDGGELTHFDVGTAAVPGINYRLSINTVAPGEPLDAGYVEEGAMTWLKALAGGAPALLIGNTNLVAVGSGVCSNINYFIGEDLDGDGLPDAWERFMITAVGPEGGLTNLTDVRPGDDFDGDRASNLDELLAGTFAFLASDVLSIVGWAETDEGGYELEFLSTAGLSYRVKAAPDLVSGSWEVTPVATGVGEVADQSAVFGDGDYRTVYFPSNGVHRFFHLIAE